MISTIVDMFPESGDEQTFCRGPKNRPGICLVLQGSTLGVSTEASLSQNKVVVYAAYGAQLLSVGVAGDVA